MRKPESDNRFHVLLPLFLSKCTVFYSSERIYLCQVYITYSITQEFVSIMTHNRTQSTLFTPGINTSHGVSKKAILFDSAKQSAGRLVC